jgi:(S)-ureidoglycine aminohydrolase
MRPVNQLVHSRARVRQRYALLPIEGYPASRLPTWPSAQCKILAAPALGAAFSQYLIDLPAQATGQFTAETQIETFHYVLSGAGRFHGGAHQKHALSAGSFGLTPPGASAEFRADEDQPLRLLLLRKRYEPAPGVEPFQAVHGQEEQVTKETWGDNPRTRLQTLIPDEFAFDMAMNIFTFDPGFGLPVVETHVMEHGLYFLEGKGVYYLEDAWMEVEKDDFIWMGPYCPQSFYATGPVPARYIYYKNVNRDIVI